MRSRRCSCSSAAETSLTAAWFYDGSARVLRALPDFRGKWQVVGVMHRWLVALLPAQARVRLVTMKDGTRMRWDLDDDSEAHAYWLGRYDDALREAVLALLPARATVLDVGANVGGWTVPLARALQPGGGRVVAFEPVPSNRARLDAAVSLNGVARAVQVESIALGETAGEVGMWLKSSVTGATTGTAAVAREGGHLRVPMCTLDQWMAQSALPSLDFMKLDIEGAELLLLRGADETVQRHRPLVLAEFESYWMSTFGITRADAESWAISHGYAFFHWDRHARRFVPGMHAGADESLLVPVERRDQLFPPHG